MCNACLRNCLSCQQVHYQQQGNRTQKMGNTVDDKNTVGKEFGT